MACASASLAGSIFPSAKLALNNLLYTLGNSGLILIAALQSSSAFLYSLIAINEAALFDSMISLGLISRASV